MSYDPHDTIAAIASPPGSAARGIVRISGPGARDCVADIWTAAPTEPDLRSLQRATMLTGALEADGLVHDIPCRLYIWPTDRSYTRQPMVEIHTIGSPPILEAVLRTVSRVGARLAGPGEFTLRAFLAGRLDLTAAEAVLGVIDAGTRQQLDVALAQLAGGLAVPLTRLRSELLDLLAHLEAGLDFDEEDIEFISKGELRRQLAKAAEQVQKLVDQTAMRTVVRECVRVVLVGSPNAGKSSLFNALAGRRAALVSPQAGTTRDYLVSELLVDGVRIELVDTAGDDRLSLEQSANSPQLPGIAEAAHQATRVARAQAAIEILCVDQSRPLGDWEAAELARRPTRSRIVVLTKCDRSRMISPIPSAVETSSTTGQGLAELVSRIRAEATGAPQDSAWVVATTAARCHDSLRSATDGLHRALVMVEQSAGEELVAAEVRGVLNELGQVVGAVYTDDILDRIFSRFCIGK